MRLKITKQLRGTIDGVDLSQFKQGEIYDVGSTFAGYLLAMGAAEPVPDTPKPPSLFSDAHDRAARRPKSSRKPH